jgi:hypothetical protein
MPVRLGPFYVAFPKSSIVSRQPPLRLTVTLAALPAMSLLPVAPFILLNCALRRAFCYFPRFSPEKFPLLFRQTDAMISVVSASEIIKELPRLSEAERRAIREGLLEIANQDSDVALCNQTALDGALMLDRLEDEDAGRQSR